MEVLMSRTSRRVSRPLIVVLSLVIIVGVVLTVHKLHQSRAQAKKAVPLAMAVEALPINVAVAQPHPVVAQTPAKIIPIPPAPTPVVRATSPESTTLVTQTPTEKVAADPAADSQPLAKLSAPAPTSVATPAPTPAATPAPSLVHPPEPTASTVDSSENDAAGLAQWAKGAKPAASTVIATSTTPHAPALAPAPTPTPAMAHDVAPPVHTEISVAPLTDAKAKVDEGDLITARQILNDALIAGRGGDPDTIKKQIEQINESLIFSARKVAEDPWGGSYQVTSGERLGSIAARSSVSWELLSRINGVTPKKLRSGQWIKLVKGPFHAVVYKHLFRMELYLGAPGGAGSMYVRSFQVGLGKDNSTPTGLWMCKSGDKIRNPRYYPPRGGDVIAPDDPKNPLAGYWIAIEGTDGQALGKESYGIHGTIDPDSIGKMESMGCIRLKADDIAWVFDMLVDGKSKVLVKD
jgi:LysM repeat protein